MQRAPGIPHALCFSGEDGANLGALSRENADLYLSGSSKIESLDVMQAIASKNHCDHWHSRCAGPIVCLIESIREQGSMRVSIITGGGSGIGAAVARRLAGRDECLMLHGQGADAAGLERLKAVAADCQRAGANVAWHTGDLANAGTASELVRRDARGVRKRRCDRPCRGVCGSARFRAVAARGARTVVRGHGHGVSRIGGLGIAGPDARIARTRRRHQQFRGPSLHA